MPSFAMPLSSSPSFRRLVLAFGFLAAFASSRANPAPVYFADAGEVAFSTAPASDTSGAIEAAVEIAPAPGATQARALRLLWQGHRGKYIYGFLKRASHAVVEAPGRYRLTARVAVEQLGPECTRLALRLVDRTGEIHQFVVPVTPGEPGWIDVSWIVDTANPKAHGSHSSWGGEATGVVHPPLRVRGFSIPFNGWSTGGGELWVDRLTVSPVAE